MIIASGLIGGYATYAVDADGANDYLIRTGGLTGIADGKLGLLSLWIKAPAPASSRYLMFVGTAGRLRIIVSNTSGAYFTLSGMTSTPSTAVSMNTGTNVVCDDNWHHILAAWDASADANCKIYLDGADVTTLDIRNNLSIDYATAGNTALLADTAGSFKYDGDIAEFYFTTEWLDITSAANRAKFARGGRPTSLGADGSKPTGTAPLIYLKGPASNWGTNAGSGGDFTVNGTFTDASTKPSY